MVKNWIKKRNKIFEQHPILYCDMHILHLFDTDWLISTHMVGLLGGSVGIEISIQPAEPAVCI